MAILPPITSHFSITLNLGQDHNLDLGLLEVPVTFKHGPDGLTAYVDQPSLRARLAEILRGAAVELDSPDGWGDDSPDALSSTDTQDLD